MKKNELRALLAVTVIAVPLVFTTGCGKKAETTPVDTITETVSPTPIPETVEEDLADEGIEVTPTPEVNEVEIDTSMADTYYVIAEEGIPYYAENDTASEVLGTLAYDSEVTALGMSTETNLFQIELADGTTAWVSSDNLDVVKGGYQVDEETAIPSEETSNAGTSRPADGSFETEINGETVTVTPANPEDLPDSFAGQDWYEALSPEDKAKFDEALEAVHNGTSEGTWDNSWADEFEHGNGEAPVISDVTIGSGEGLTPDTLN